MKRWWPVILAASLGACSINMESRTTTGKVQSSEREMTAEERVFLASLEVARDNALQTVNWLLEEGNADNFLGQVALCGANAFLCTPTRPP
jgi:hypothetical protein